MRKRNAGGAHYAFVDGQPHAVDVVVNFMERRPVGWFVVRKLATYGINAKREKPIEFLIERRDAKCVAQDQVCVEGFEVTEVKKNAMPLRNRPVINCLRANQAKKLIGPRTSGCKPLRPVTVNGIVNLPGGSTRGHGGSALVSCCRC